MPEVPGVRRALGELLPGTRTTVLDLRSGERLRGEFLGYDGAMVRIRTSQGVETVEAEEVIRVTLEKVSTGPE